MNGCAFHPAVAAWFQETFAAPTECQVRAWQAVKQGRHTLIAAPTGSGKTLAAFLAAIDDLAHLAQAGELREETRILYISPLKALSNDVCKNLEQPLADIDRKLFELGYAGAPIRSQVRTGDTPQAARSAMGKFPPHILVTTPESAYVLLTSDGGRRLLKTVGTVIVDEIHAVAGSKRGSHLALTLERLERLVSPGLIRIGLSATQKPIATVADFLTGGRPCTIVDSGHRRRLDLGLELPESPLEAVLSHEAADQIYQRMAELIRAHRTTLVFVNTRRLAERVSRALIERLGEDKVAAHHGSLAKEQRLAAEGRLKAGELQALVATASLELGIDVGEVDLVCQLGTVGAIATFLQRVGRAGHQLGGLPKGRLFPASRDELIQGIALLDAVQQGELDLLHIPDQPLDVLAQQMVAMTACEDWDEAELYATLRRAWPYRNLEPATFDAVVKMLAEGYTTRRGTRGAWLHRDAIHRRLKARRGARLTALTCGGAIPDNAEYRVIVEPSGEFVGTVDEDFAIESLGGDIFQLGNASWRVLRLETSTLRVEDAHGIPPNIPFWFGEAPGRSWELSTALARTRLALAGGDALAWLEQRGVGGAAARQAVDYMAAAQATLGVVPTLDTVIFERFFDEAGGMQFIIHAPYGSRVNRAWGLALRKRFCRTFNFELQAAATEDAVILSLGVGQSFPLEAVAKFLHPNTVRDILVQALLAAPMFTVRWRWNAACALAIRRFQGGRKTPPHLLRMQAEDLVTAVFPDQLACFENIQGDREVPDHPLVNQTVHDCLFEAMDFERFLWVVQGLNDGSIRVVAKDLVEPSPLAAAILNAKPYAFLDGAPAEERRTRAVASRRWLDPATASDLGRLDPEAVAAVRGEAWPIARDADELHDALLQAGYIRAVEAEPAWAGLLQNLIRQGRATILVPGECNPCESAMADEIRKSMIAAFRPPLPLGEGWGEGEIKKAATIYSPHLNLLKEPELWIAAERWPWFRALNPAWTTQPPLHLPPELEQKAWDSEAALTEIVRARLCCCGPLTAGDIAVTLALAETQVEAALLRLESEGFVLRGQFTEPGSGQDGVQTPPPLEWCERSLLARIHRYTINRLRREIEPVSTVRFMNFLLRWQHVHPEHRLQGRNALAAVLEQLEGYEAAAVAWESAILAARLADYDPSWLDGLCQAGRFVWTRLTPSGGQTPVKNSPLTFLPRKLLGLWQRPGGDEPTLSGNARRLMDTLRQRGALFFEELYETSGLLKTQVEDALAELVAQGLVRCDSFIGLRAMLVPEDKKRRLRQIHDRGARAVPDHETSRAPRSFPSPQPSPTGRGGTRSPRPSSHPLFGLEDAGRWTLVHSEPAPLEAGREHIARTLLRRYGVVFKALLARESAIPPWQELLSVYRRLEARGEIRGGRFVAAQYGEQFALPEAVEQLRKTPDADDGVLLALSAVDPLNLLGGTLLGGTKLPALPGNRLLLQGGAPVAVLLGKEVRFLVEIPQQRRWELQNRLLRR